MDSSSENESDRLSDSVHVGDSEKVTDRERVRSSEGDSDMVNVFPVSDRVDDRLWETDTVELREKVGVTVNTKLFVCE